jgi:hypothetical protein
MLCEIHIVAAAASAGEIILALNPDLMVMPQGEPMAIQCGHVVHAGDHVVSHGGRWTCEACALGRQATP